MTCCTIRQIHQGSRTQWVKNSVTSGWLLQRVECYSIEVRKYAVQAHMSTTKGSGEGNSVVIVDDNAAVRKTVGHALLGNGFRYYGEAENGAEGIEVVKELKPDLAILDLSMPVMNGLQAALVLRKLFPHMPIILFSLYGDGAVKAEAARAGVDAVVSKTVDMPVLIGKAHELLKI